MSTIRSAIVAFGATALAAAIVPMAPVQAAASHFNTDPYQTGCAKSAFTLSTRAVSGGTAYIKVSRNCGTNWIEYRGKKQTTTKRTMDHRTNRWTRAEVDNLPWSYSMQSYAPGTTKLTATILIGSTTTTATCASTCSWKAATAPPSLNTRVDAFVTKYNGKYADFDGRYGAQCVDLVQFYNRDVVRARFMSTPFSGGAKDIWWTYDASRYTKVARTSAPRKGDVAIWGPGVYGGSYGHIAIVLGDAGSSIRTLTQNPGATKVANLSKAGLLGYLRPRS